MRTPCCLPSDTADITYYHAKKWLLIFLQQVKFLVLSIAESFSLSDEVHLALFMFGFMYVSLKKKLNLILLDNKRDSIVTGV